MGEDTARYYYPAWKRVWLLIIFAVLIVVFADVAFSADSTGGLLSRGVMLALSVGSLVLMVVMAKSPFSFSFEADQVVGKYYSGVKRSWKMADLRLDDSRSDLWGSFRVYDGGGMLQFRFWTGLRGLDKFKDSFR